LRGRPDILATYENQCCYSRLQLRIHHPVSA
jgi:hypothetical protein